MIELSRRRQIGGRTVSTSDAYRSIPSKHTFTAHRFLDGTLVNGMADGRKGQQTRLNGRLKLETRLSKWTQRHKFSYSVQKKTLMFKRKRLQDYCNIFRANPIFTIGCTYDKTFSVLSYVESLVIMGIARKMQQQSQRLFLLAIQVFFHVEK